MVRVLLAASLAALAMLASAQILSPVNGNNYTIFNAHNNRCALLVGPFTNDYVPVVMGSCGGDQTRWTAHVNPTDATLVSFSSVAVPGSWLSYSTLKLLEDRTACTSIPLRTTLRTNGTLAGIPPFALPTPPPVES
ncbi:hypothetical protein C8F04DRAFT_1107257 [Mycena alexandri]|uniref:Secreted protein n=1 Tax=Mycena alexandri TaxID=1745969 RepID=A0AAD6ST20_9AGAR|nr:hypothetical protein C8F04DRAFT_1107257 [Mycena alexandri]